MQPLLKSDAGSSREPCLRFVVPTGFPRVLCGQRLQRQAYVRIRCTTQHVERVLYSRISRVKAPAITSSWMLVRVSRVCLWINDKPGQEIAFG